MPKVVEALLPSDPLEGTADLPSIELVVPWDGDDVELLELVLSAAVRSSRNPVGSIRLVTAADAVPSFDTGGVVVSIESDGEVVGRDLLRRVERLVPLDRRGWVVQQLVKILTVLRSRAPGCLVLDADTVLLRPRTWLTSTGVQALVVTDEFHEPYVAHAARVWGLPRPAVSHVAHHQLQRPSVVREMFGTDGERLGRWLELGDWRELSSVSEYHGYGAWLLSRHPAEVRLVRWRNVELPRSILRSRDPEGSMRFELVAAMIPDAHSASLHHHLDAAGRTTRRPAGAE